MLKDRNQRHRILGSLILIIAAFVLASCGGSGSGEDNIVNEYYSAIENGDADAAASLFAEDAVIVTPSGNVLTGIDAIKSTFIPYDLQNMDRVEFLSDFSESGGKISWTQTWHHVEGDAFMSDCEVTTENGKIVEWLFN